MISFAIMTEIDKFRPKNPELQQEQMVLINRIKAGQKASTSLQNSKNISLEEQERLQQVFENGQQAKIEFISKNIGLVKKFAFSLYNSRPGYYQARGYDHEYLILSGKIGLLKGLNTYNPQKGSVSNHMTIWIRWQIRLDTEDELIKLPERIKRIVAQIFYYENALTQSLRRQPTLEEISQESGIPLKMVTNLLNIVRPPLSLDYSDNSSSRNPSSLHMDEIVPNGEDSTEKSAERLILRKSLESYLLKLDPQRSDGNSIGSRLE